MNDYISKPIDPEVLMQKCFRLIGGSIRRA